MHNVWHVAARGHLRYGSINPTATCRKKARNGCRAFCRPPLPARQPRKSPRAPATRPITGRGVVLPPIAIAIQPTRRLRPKKILRRAKQRAMR